MPTHTSLMNNVLASVPTTTGAMDINQPYPPHLLSTKAVSVSPDAVVYNYRIESKDLVNGRIKHQTFTGNVTMVKNNNNWIIQDQDGQLADSYYE